MKKKGFTLIELLAVIVILAIIALIATPLVLKYIESSKEKSAKISANTYAEAVEKEYVSKLTINEIIPNGTYNIEQLDGFGVKVKGTKPKGDNDYVVLNNGNVTEYELTINNYLVQFKDNKVTVYNKDSQSITNVNKVKDGYTVVFKKQNEIYEVVNIKKGNAVNKPATNPVFSEGYSFSGWQIDSKDISFPYIPTKDVEITADFSQHKYLVKNNQTLVDYDVSYTYATGQSHTYENGKLTTKGDYASQVEINFDVGKNNYTKAFAEVKYTANVTWDEWLFQFYGRDSENASVGYLKLTDAPYEGTVKIDLTGDATTIGFSINSGRSMALEIVNLWLE